MLLRKKTQLIVGITLVCLVITMFSVSRMVLLNRFAELEERTTRREVERASLVLSDQIETLDTLVYDWAAWDDTYAFVKDRNEDYILSNLVDETFIDLRLNFMLYLDDSGDTVYAKGFDWQNEHVAPVPAGLQAQLRKDSLLLRHLSPESYVRGVLQIPEGPIMLASRPILTSQNEGPIRGTLIMGRFVDTLEIEKLAQILHLPMNLVAFDDPQMSPDFKAAKSALAQGETTFIQPQSAAFIAGYTVVYDVYDRPALILRVRQPREIYSQGQLSQIFLLALLAIGIFFGGIVILLLERMVLSRLATLSQSVSRIGAKRDPSARVTLSGDDELARLADNINEMLAALERSQRELGESETKLRRLIEQSTDGIALTDERGIVIEWNKSQEQITNIHRQDALGGVIWDLPVYRRMDGETPAPRDTRRPSPTVESPLAWISAMNQSQELEITWPDGRRRTVHSVAFPIETEQGWMVGIITRDVTERKQVEHLLSQRLQEQETVFAIGQLVSSSLDIDDVLQQVAEQMTRLVDATSCAISDWDPEAGTLTVQAEYICPSQQNPDNPIDDIGVAYEISQYPVTAAALERQETFVVYRNDPKGDPRERQLLALYGWAAVAGIPLVVRGRVIGLAEVYLADENRTFRPHDLRLLRALANQVAVAIENARLFSAVRANEQALRDLSLRLLRVQEQERRLIAQELHDEFGQLLTAAKISINLAQRKVSQLAAVGDENVLDVLQSRLKDASNLTDKVLTNVRALTVELRPTLLDDMGIVPTLRWYIGQFATRTDIEVVFQADELDRRLQPAIEAAIYRAVVEALTNIARHAQASYAEVQLTCSDQTITTTIMDNGRGFDVEAWRQHTAKTQSLGLVGIEERAMLLGGRASISSEPGAGTRIVLELPITFT